MLKINPYVDRILQKSVIRFKTNGFSCRQKPAVIPVRPSFDAMNKRTFSFWKNSLFDEGVSEWVLCILLVGVYHINPFTPALKELIN